MKKNNPHFYIVIPSFNQAQFITQTIESVFLQKKNVSLYVIDGKSTDDTLKILKSYGSKLIWKSEKDEGQTDAINKGIDQFLKHAKENDIFAYINSDDFYKVDVFGYVVDAFEKHPSKQWLIGDAFIVDTSGKKIQHAIRLYKRLWRLILKKWLLFILNPIPQPAVFIKVKALKKVGLFNKQLHYTMDYEYWLRLYEKVGNPIVVPGALAAFRIHSASKGTTAFKKQFAEEYTVATRYTKNKSFLFFHLLHNQFIISLYRWLK
ncbi:glycosyltransferase [Candidatus Cerribacteria bacterium 'Amazon FNV 2010 28 9']|uniref:Glycosyltransferase n=1 Tax=Candidatus Cerribacteria bacterium 'Amazon FNV 2010 28 9' TaxID=2081795 RepID=A0A317JNT6_9BACT|nr:MAG: glycosyltransferase [Candidatus Cerribacteria bacterium 'Amazon FNV 2010 28 9']